MTIEINLLPWREERRARRSRRFHGWLLLSVLLGLGGGYGMTLYLQEEIEVQSMRNAHIQSRSQELDASMREIGEVEQVREQMLEQVRVFTELQRGRALTVEMMSDLTTSLVDGVFYTRLERQGDSLFLVGVAENNRQVSDQLRALGAARSFGEAMLSEVEAREGGGQRSFSLGMQQRAPVDGGGDEVSDTPAGEGA